MPEIVREHTHCRVCQSDRLETYLDLGVQPLANAFRKPDDTSPELTSPLVLARCLDCGLSQLRHVVDRDVLYRHYLYESGHSEGWRRHCAELADEIAALYPSGSVCEIASNDGTLLKVCWKNGLSALGVDPAANLAAQALGNIVGYWGTELVSWAFAPDLKFNVVVAQNVLGHVDDVQDFFRAISTVLAPGGRAIIECPHVHPLLDNGAFDTVYHEHLSYWSLHPLMEAAGKAKLQVVRVEQFPELHGGTWRYYLAHSPAEIPNAAEILKLMEWEDATLTPGVYTDFWMMVRHTVRQLAWTLKEYAPIHAFGASAKSTVLLNALPREACTHIQAIYDDTPAKQGCLSPGIGLSVQPSPLDFSGISTLLITAPNWADALKAKAVARGFHGRFILPWHGVQVQDNPPAGVQVA